MWTVQSGGGWRLGWPWQFLKKGGNEVCHIDWLFLSLEHSQAISGLWIGLFSILGLREEGGRRRGRETGNYQWVEQSEHTHHLLSSQSYEGTVCGAPSFICSIKDDWSRIVTDTYNNNAKFEMLSKNYQHGTQSESVLLENGADRLAPHRVAQTFHLWKMQYPWKCSKVKLNKVRYACVSLLKGMV